VGSQGEEVRSLQKKMGELGFDCKGLDGIYGANTKLAVEAF
jgi:peptidoglycan hydrolase-like protein with peptidoglycan-binding domain